MISGIGSSTNYFSSLFATNGTSGSSSTSSLAQTEEKLFAGIDTNGDGSISQGEFSSFLGQAAAATGGTAPSTAQANALFSQMSNGGSSISLQQFESNAGDLVTALQNEIAAGSSASGTSSTSSLLSQLAQSAQSLVAGSAAGITSSNSSNATSNTNSSNSAAHHHHHGHGGGGSSLISQFMQQYQAAGATTTTAASTLSATA